MSAHDILNDASLFPAIATPDEIEQVRQWLEAQRDQTIKVFEIETVTRSGTRCTRVMWEAV